jgi:dTMP kinase
LRRAVSRNADAPQDEGRFEAEDLRFHRRVREGYLSMARAEPARFAIVDGDGSVDEVFQRTLETLHLRAPGLFA